MGKKKPQKTKELSVAIAEASSTGDEAQQQPQVHTPRKRGRPRKIIEKAESTEEEQSKALVEEAAAEGEEEAGKESLSKKAKGGEDEDEDEQQQEEELKQQKKVKEGASSGKKEEVIKASDPSRGRARRKSKPRKSSQH